MTDTPWRNWEALWASARKAALQLGAECEPAQVAPPAELREVERVEADLGRALPQSLRSVVLGFSRKVSFRWQLPDDAERPEEFDEIFAGEVGWNLDELVELERSRKGWIEACFPDTQNEYDAIWHGKLAFFSITNGDMLAIDEAIEGSPAIYLSHDDGDGHGQALGMNFARLRDSIFSARLPRRRRLAVAPIPHMRTRQPARPRLSERPAMAKLVRPDRRLRSRCDPSKT